MTTDDISGLSRPARALQLLLMATLFCIAPSGWAQEIEPRAYSNAPVGTNFLILGYAYTQGSLSFDSSLPVTDAELETSNAVVGYARVLDLWGTSGKVDMSIPYSCLTGTAEVAGEPADRNVDGFGDARFRLSANLYGAPALKLPEFFAYQQDLIVGASFQITVPTGQYDSDRAVNLGTNRFSFKPEVGISKALGPLTLEGAFGVTFYTDNENFFGGNERSQDPLYSMRAHAIYSFGNGIWASADVTYFTGGRTTINGDVKDDLQSNWRVGATLSFPINTHVSLKLYASTGVSARTDNNYDLVGVAMQFRWGEGL